MASDRTPEPVRVELTVDEALVLDSWLERITDLRKDDDLFAGPADRIALWNLHCALESALAEPFSPRYAELLDEARQRLEGATG